MGPGGGSRTEGEKTLTGTKADKTNTKAPGPALGDSGFLSPDGPSALAARGALLGWGPVGLDGHAVSGSLSGLALPLASQ